MTNARIVDHPRGRFHPGPDMVQKLVVMEGATPLPDCCLEHLIQFVTMSMTDGPLWDVTSLQTLCAEDGRIIPPGSVCVIPKKNLAPLPDVDEDEDDEIINKELENTNAA